MVVSDSHHFARRFWLLFVLSHLPLLVLDILEILTHHFKVNKQMDNGFRGETKNDNHSFFTVDSHELTARLSSSLKQVRIHYVPLVARRLVLPRECVTDGPTDGQTFIELRSRN